MVKHTQTIVWACLPILSDQVLKSYIYIYIFSKKPTKSQNAHKIMVIKAFFLVCSNFVISYSLFKKFTACRKIVAVERDIF